MENTFLLKPNQINSWKRPEHSKEHWICKAIDLDHEETGETDGQIGICILPSILSEKVVGDGSGRSDGCSPDEP
jgi:hypothetical protein